MRQRIALAVIGLHCLLLWLLAVGFRQPEDRPHEQPQPQIVSLWIDTPAPVTLVEPPRVERARESTVPANAAVVSAPSVPAPVTPALVPRPDSNAAPTTAPQVDWANEASLVARRAGQSIGAPKAEPFSEGPQGVIQPCVPREKSMEWKGEENPGVHWHGPIPVLITGNCMITIGFFACTGGSKPNEHLLDDMQDPTRSRSSVPDARICD
jgi:hypothetical protein